MESREIYYGTQENPCADLDKAIADGLPVFHLEWDKDRSESEEKEVFRYFAADESFVENYHRNGGSWTYRASEDEMREHLETEKVNLRITVHWRVEHAGQEQHAVFGTWDDALKFGKAHALDCQCCAPQAVREDGVFADIANGKLSDPWLKAWAAENLGLPYQVVQLLNFPEGKVEKEDVAASAPEADALGL